MSYLSNATQARPRKPGLLLAEHRMDYSDESLASSLAAVYDYYLSSLTDDHQARIFARDWRVNARQLGQALRRVGGSAWWLHHEPVGAADSTPYIVGRVDSATGVVRFDLATVEEITWHPWAADFRWDGEPL